MNFIFAIILCFYAFFSMSVNACAEDDEMAYIREEVETVQSVSKYAQPLREAPASVTIITSDEIERLGYRDMSDILNAVPGFYITYDRTMSYIGVRGFGRPGDYNSRALLLINGHPVNDDIYGSADIDFSGPVDIDLISRVEVIKGPGYLYYGNNAIFAVINIVTKKPMEIDGLILSTEAGSLSTYKGASTYGKIINGYNVVLGASYTISQGKKSLYFPEYSENNGKVTDSDKYWHKTFYAQIGKDNIQVQGMFSGYDKYVPTAPNLTIFNSQDQHWKPAYSFVELSHKGEIADNLEHTLRVFYNAHEEKFNFPYNYDTYFMWLDNPKSQHYGLESKTDWKINSRNRAMFGLELRNTHIELHATDITNNITFVDVNKTYNSYSLYSQYEHRLSDNLISYLGLRYDNYTNLYNRFKSVLLPYAALTYMPNHTDTYKLSYSRSYRTPSVFEAFYITNTSDGPYGNADLNMEKWSLINGIYEKTISERINLTVNMFRYWVDNLIDSTQSSTGGVVYYNMPSKTTGTGGEAVITIKGYGSIKGDVGYSYQKVYDNTNGYLLNSPLHIVKARVSLPLYSKFVLGLGGMYVSKRKKYADPPEWTSGYYIANAIVSAKNIYKNLNLSYGLYNIFDNRYSDPVGADNYPIKAVEQNGRAFRVKLSYTF